MTPLKFKEATRTMTAPPGMANCGDLPAYASGEYFLSCWGLSWRERLSALFLGRCWLWVYSAGQPPVALEVKQTAFPWQPVGSSAWKLLAKLASPGGSRSPRMPSERRSAEEVPQDQIELMPIEAAKVAPERPPE
jgi:hypothetical protein